MSGRVVLALTVLLVLAVGAWTVRSLSGLVSEHAARRAAEAEERLARRAEAAALDLAERVERARDLLRSVADAGPLRDVLQARAERAPADEAHAVLDRLLPRLLSPERSFIELRVLDADGAPVAGMARRAGAALSPFAPVALSALARGALEGAAGSVALEVVAADGGSRLEVAAPVDVGRRRAVAILSVDVSAELEGCAAAAGDGGAWALVDDEGRVVAPAGAEAPARPAGLLARGSGAATERGEVAAAFAIGAARGWELRVRRAIPPATSDELLDAVVVPAATLLPLLLVVVALPLWARGARQSERRNRFLQSVFDAITDPLVVVDAALVITHQNRVAATRLGGSLVGRAWADAIAARRAAPHDELAAVREVLSSGKPRRAEVEEPATGTVWALVQFPIVDDGEVQGVVEYARDVTQTRRLQAALVQSEKLSTLGEMAAGMAHEINNPIGVVSMFAQLLKEEVAGGVDAARAAEVVEKLETIESQALHVGEIVTNLLRFSRKSEGTRARFDVRRAVERALAIVEHQKMLREVELEKALDVEPAPEVDGDEGQLAQVFLNLIVNASHAMGGAGPGGAPGRGRLRVAVTRVGGEDAPYPKGRPFGEVEGGAERVRVSVQDSGHGIPPAVLERIFEPFFTTKPTGEGTGLGLSVSFGIVREHRGLVWVDTKPGEGTTFTIDLPAAGEGAAEPRPAAVTEG